MLAIPPAMEIAQGEFLRHGWCMKCGCMGRSSWLARVLSSTMPGPPLQIFHDFALCTWNLVMHLEPTISILTCIYIFFARNSYMHMFEIARKKYFFFIFVDKISFLFFPCSFSELLDLGHSLVLNCWLNTACFDVHHMSSFDFKFLLASNSEHSA
jgi:hypothetical protein